METEKKLADILFSNNVLGELDTLSDNNFELSDRKQVSLFHKLLGKRIEERLNNQFGGCMALIDEKFGESAVKVAEQFICSQQFRHVREDLVPGTQDSPARFEIAFLNFILTTKNQNIDFLTEFGDIFLQELLLGY